MIVTVCELPDNRPEFGESWTQLVEHINQAGSGTVVLPGMAFSRWFASGLRQRGWIRWRQACPITNPRMRRADKYQLRAAVSIFGSNTMTGVSTATPGAAAAGAR